MPVARLPIGSGSFVSGDGEELGDFGAILAGGLTYFQSSLFII